MVIIEFISSGNSHFQKNESLPHVPFIALTSHDLLSHLTEISNHHSATYPPIEHTLHLGNEKVISTFLDQVCQ